MKDRISIDVHPCTKVDPECATDQLAIYIDGDVLIGYASNVEGGAISLIVNFEDQDVPLIREAVSKLVGVSHSKVGMVPDVPDDLLEDWEDDEIELEDEGSLNNDDSE
tara:strand:+ start:122 stop:445 length:324 start_codon:yes stop_codon:yes gene_type:complete